MPYRPNVILGPRVAMGLECVHADVDIAVFFLVLVVQPILERRCRDFVRRTDALDGFATATLSDENGDAVRWVEVRSDVLLRGHLFLLWILHGGHDFSPSFR